MSEVKESAPFQEEQSLLDSLTKPEGVTINIIPPEKYDVPQELDLSRFPTDERPYAEESFMYVNEYLKLPIISDTFPSTDSRKNWRNENYDNIQKSKGEQAAEDFKTMLKGNKLASNRIYSLVGFVTFFNEYLPKDERAEMQAIIDYSYDLNKRELNGELDGPTTKARIEEVEKLSRNAVAVLNKFAK